LPISRPDVKNRAVKFPIITPSFRNSRWLKLCIASVADQQGVEFEHIVQDSCSDDGTQDWLPRDSRVKAFIEKDGGMYDAVNRGKRSADFRIGTNRRFPANLAESEFGAPGAVSWACCPNHFGDGGARLPARDRLAIHRSLSESQPQHVRHSKTRGISCARLATFAAAGGTPALRSLWATRPHDAPPRPS